MIREMFEQIVLRYFDLNTNRRPPEPSSFKMMDKGDAPLFKLDEKDTNRFRIQFISIWDQLVTYLGICVGIIFSNALMTYNSTGSVNFDFQPNEIIISTIIGIVIYPNIYKKLAGTKDPFFYRFALAVQNGVFWQVIFGSVM